MHGTFDSMELDAVLLAICRVALSNSDDGILHLGLLELFVSLMLCFEHKHPFVNWICCHPQVLRSSWISPHFLRNK
jgi:hypothetical protein